MVSGFTSKNTAGVHMYFMKALHYWLPVAIHKCLYANSYSSGSVNAFVGKHPLGDRARKIDQGILIVRFELPYNIWCDGCGKHIGKGVRYNAEKKKVGNYYSTPIWSFRMKCHLCDNWIEIHTDPKNAQYIVVGGARQKVETWDPEDTETIKLKDDDEQRKLAEDSLYKLEHTVKDEKKATENATVLTRLQVCYVLIRFYLKIAKERS
ncbi:hypothetical protein G9A89_023820 [Geosiphon pyriformis]|nr:hypothetical protein G9A89_023820 [Geosiphon pyriformis]